MKNLILSFAIFTGLMALVCFIFGDFLRAAFYVILTGFNHWSYNNFKKAEKIKKQLNEQFNEEIAKLDKEIEKNIERMKEIEKELKELDENEEKNKND